MPSPSARNDRSIAFLNNGLGDLGAALNGSFRCFAGLALLTHNRPSVPNVDNSGYPRQIRSLSRPDGCLLISVACAKHGCLSEGFAVDQQTDR